MTSFLIGSGIVLSVFLSGISPLVLLREKLTRIEKRLDKIEAELGI